MQLYVEPGLNVGITHPSTGYSAKFSLRPQPDNPSFLELICETTQGTNTIQLQVGDNGTVVRIVQGQSVSALIFEGINQAYPAS